MRGFGRGMLIVLVGLGAAFGIFRALGWPSTLSAPGTTQEIGFNQVEAGELLHAGLGPFTVVGARPIEILSVRPELSPGIELVAVRLSVLGAENFVSVGALRGPSDEVDQLPGASGAVLRSGQRGFLVLTIKVDSPGSYRIPGVRITYGSGWLRRTKIVGPSVTAEMTATPSPTASAT